MISSTAALAADDVSISCRVRRSNTVSNPIFDEFAEMTCTMRDWKPLNPYNNGLTIESAWSNNPATVATDPELLFSPVQRVTDIMGGEHIRSFHSQGSNVGLENGNSGSGNNSRNSSRSGSRGRATSNSRAGSSCRRRRWADLYEREQRQQQTINQEEKKETDVVPFSIPISDILVVDTEYRKRNAPIFVTTTNNGYFELRFSTQNSHDVLLAFLTNSLPSERLTKCLSPSIIRTSSSDDASSTEIFNVESLTARRIREKVRGETFGERVRRKMNLFASRIGEFSTTIIVECNACCAATTCIPSSPPKQAFRRSNYHDMGDDSNRDLPEGQQQYEFQTYYNTTRRSNDYDDEYKHNDSTSLMSCGKMELEKHDSTSVMSCDTTSCI